MVHAMMSKADRLTVFEKATEIILDRGWTQSEYQDESGAVCLLGACYLAMTGHGWMVDEICAVDLQEELDIDLLLSDFTGDLWACAASWNDARGRTKQQVLSMLDRMAAHCRS